MSERPIDQSSGVRGEELGPLGSPGRGRTAGGARFETDVGPSTGRNSEPVERRPAERTAEDFGHFAMESLARGPPDSVEGLREAAILSTHAANALFRAAEEEKDQAFEKARVASHVRALASELKASRDRLSEEAKLRRDLVARVRTLSKSEGLLKRSQQECRDAQVAQFSAVRELALAQAELAEARAEIAELKMASLRREDARGKEDSQSSAAGGESSGVPRT